MDVVCSGCQPKEREKIPEDEVDSRDGSSPCRRSDVHARLDLDELH